MKRCSRCGVDKLLDAFGRHSSRGVQNYCRDCMRAYGRERHAAKRDDLNQQMREYYVANRERASERNRKWRMEHHDERATYHRDYRTAHTAALRAALVRWRKANPDRGRVYAGNRRARMNGAESSRVHPLVVLELDDGLCGICGNDVDPMNFHVDHRIPLSRGGWHAYDNVQAAHPLCNQSKFVEVPE